MPKWVKVMNRLETTMTHLLVPVTITRPSCRGIVSAFRSRDVVSR